MVVRSARWQHSVCAAHRGLAIQKPLRKGAVHDHRDAFNLDPSRAIALGQRRGKRYAGHLRLSLQTPPQLQQLIAEGIRSSVRRDADRHDSSTG
jgi:hypothetical protein